MYLLLIEYLISTTAAEEEKLSTCLSTMTGFICGIMAYNCNGFKLVDGALGPETRMVVVGEVHSRRETL